MKYLGFLFALSLLITTAACGDDDSSDPKCETTGITYTNTIANVFATCTDAGCHVSNAPVGVGSLANYNDASNFENEAMLLCALRHENGCEAMPRNKDKLTDCTIDKIEAWLAAGKPE